MNDVGEPEQPSTLRRRRHSSHDTTPPSPASSSSSSTTASPPPPPIILQQSFLTRPTWFLPIPPILLPLFALTLSNARSNPAPLVGITIAALLRPLLTALADVLLPLLALRKPSSTCHCRCACHCPACISRPQGTKQTWAEAAAEWAVWGICSALLVVLGLVVSGWSVERFPERGDDVRAAMKAAADAWIGWWKMPGGVRVWWNW